jgi:dCTP deaminase
MRAILDKRLVVTPLLHANQIGSTSIDIRLGFEFGVFNVFRHTHLDPFQDESVIEAQVLDYVKKVNVSPMEAYILHPEEFVLAATLESFRLPGDLAGRLEGRSTWGRLGLQVHSTAGFVDPGFEGKLTFELRNVGKGALSLFPGVRIGQICFYSTKQTLIPYTKKEGAKYHDQLGIARSKFYQDWEFEVIRRHRPRERPANQEAMLQGEEGPPAMTSTDQEQ